MGIGKLLWRIYVMDLPDAALLALLGTVLFCLIRNKLECRIWWRWLCGCMLALAVVSILYVTLARRESGDYGIYLIPFYSYREAASGGNRELYRSNFMNVLLFYPAGLFTNQLLPDKWPRWIRLLLPVLGFAVISGGIEYVQYRYSLGRCEIDDVIHNALGGFLGGAAPGFLYWLKRKWEESVSHDR